MFPVHPLLWHFFKKGKALTLYATNRAIARGWADAHGIDEYKYIGPTDLKHKVEKKPPCCVLYDFDPKTLAAIRKAGYRTITPEGFEYK
jgi:hypothetical protein